MSESFFSIAKQLVSLGSSDLTSSDEDNLIKVI